MTDPISRTGTDNPSGRLRAIPASTIMDCLEAAYDSGDLVLAGDPLSTTFWELVSELARRAGMDARPDEDLRKLVDVCCTLLSAALPAIDASGDVALADQIGTLLADTDAPDTRKHRFRGYRSPGEDGANFG